MQRKFVELPVGQQCRQLTRHVTKKGTALLCSGGLQRTAPAPKLFSNLQIGLQSFAKHNKHDTMPAHCMT